MKFKNKKVLGVMIVSLVVLATAFSGCLGSDTTEDKIAPVGGVENKSAPSGVEDGGKHALSAGEIATKAMSRLAEVKTYSAKMSMTSTEKDIVTKMDMDMRVDMAERKMFMNMTSEMWNMEMYALGNTTYMQMPGVGWVKLSAEDMGVGVDIWQENDEVQKLQKLMDGSVSEYLGEETVSGVGCYKIKVTPSEKELNDYLEEFRITKISDNFSVFLWVSKDSYAVMKQSVLIQSGTEGVDMTVVYDYAPVVIILPADALNEKTMEEMMAEMYAGTGEVDVSRGT